MRFRIISAACLLFSTLEAQNATVLESSTEFECTGSKSAVCRQKKVVLIRNEKGDDQADFVCACDPGNELDKFSGLVTDAEGKVIEKIKKGDLTRSEYSQGLADEDYYYLYSYSPKSYPVTVTYEWEEKFQNVLRAYPKFVPQTDYEVDVVKSSYRFITTPENSVRWHMVNCDVKVGKSEVKGKTVYDFELDSLPAIHHYGYGLPLREQAPRVLFAPDGFDIENTHCDLTSWKALGLWSWQLLQGRDALPQELTEKLHQMTDTCSSDWSKVEVVRRFMGVTTRYVSIQLGIGGWQPMSATEVYQKGIGDCKALTNYLCSMLHAIGIPAVYATIATGQTSLLHDFPSMAQLDHVVAMVPLKEDSIWIECTNPRVPVGYCPDDMWAGHEAVLVTADGGTIVRTPALPLREHKEVAHYDIKVDAAGNATVSSQWHETGRCYETDASMARLSDKDQRKAILESLHLPKATLNDLKASTQGASFDLSFNAVCEGYGRKSGSRIFVPISPFRFSSMRNTKEPAHVIDMRESGYIHTDSITIELPEGFEVETLPKEKVDISEYGVNLLSVKAEGTQIQVIVTSIMNNGEYPIEKYDGWITFRKNRTALTKGEIVIRSKQ